MTAKDILLAKKRMMFIKGEDYNFLSYNIIVLLESLGCYDQKRSFIDHRKLSFLVDFVSQPSLAAIVVRRNRLGSSLGKRDLKSLYSAYADGESRKHFVERVLFSLNANKKISLIKAEGAQYANVWMNSAAVPEGFRQSDLFSLERDNIGRIREISAQVRTCGLSTFLANFFERQGVQVWRS